MSELTEPHVNFLKNLESGGLVAIAMYGKKELTMELLSRPTCYEVGLKGIDYLRDLGLVRYGDPSPYKSGTINPIVLTEAGKSAVVGVSL